MMMGFKETLWDYCRFSVVLIWAKITWNFHLRSSACQGAGPHQHMTSVMKKVTEEITMTLIFFASSGLPHERSFTIKCIIEGKHIEVPICNKWFLPKSVDLKPRLVLANLRNLQNVRRQIKWFRHVWVLVTKYVGVKCWFAETSRCSCWKWRRFPTYWRRYVSSGCKTYRER